MTKVLVIGGAGYVGSALVPSLLKAGYEVVVYDLFLYNSPDFSSKRQKGLTLIHGDVRDHEHLRLIVRGCDKVIHLACISNDPSCELDPGLSKSINLDSFFSQVDACWKAGIERFIFASSSSVYGISDLPLVTEETERLPISQYNRYKAMCENELFRFPSFPFIILRPATICGLSPRMRLDLTVNMLTAQAMTKGAITVFGGTQYRPNLHITDMVECYKRMLEAPLETVRGQAFNVGYQNMTVSSIASMVADTVSMITEKTVDVFTVPSNDPRSYTISSQKIRDAIGFIPANYPRQAAMDVARTFQNGTLPWDALDRTEYNNTKRLKELGLK